MDKELNCPCCGATLKDAYAEANYGRVLLLDQCPACGGVWFDRWELYFVKEDSLTTLAKVDPVLFASEHSCKEKQGECPRCAAGLKDFIDPNIPKGASIKRCPSCSGLWLNRGELNKYAAYKASLKGMLQQMPGDAPLTTLRSLQKELDTSTLTKKDTPGTLMLDEPPLDGKEFATDVGFIILQTLLRLVFKF